ncbi:MAG: TIGR01906 family membrane protein [Chloroflexi bacterium]|nr:TIGR01906 family membrane protein [Chloroflexota bacterium]
MRIAQTVALVIFIIGIPLLVFSSAVRFVVNDLRLYHNGFLKYDIPSVTGIEINELDRAARELVQYFNSDDDFVRIVLKSGVSLYNEKEIVHLKDVKDLIQFDYRLQWIALAYVAGYAALALALRRKRALAGLGRAMTYGGGLTLALMGMLGVAMVVAFDRVFIAFHLIGFSNMLWVLDPATDRLIQMFPEGFFFDAALYLAGVTLGGALGVGVVGWGLKRLQRHAPIKEKGTAQ